MGYCLLHAYFSVQNKTCKTEKGLHFSYYMHSSSAFENNFYNKLYESLYFSYSAILINEWIEKKYFYITVPRDQMGLV